MTTSIMLNNPPCTDIQNKMTKELVTTAHVKNTRSQRVLKKAKFEFMGYKGEDTYWRMVRGTE